MNHNKINFSHVKIYVKRFFFVLSKERKICFVINFDGFVWYCDYEKIYPAIGTNIKIKIVISRTYYRYFVYLLMNILLLLTNLHNIYNIGFIKYLTIIYLENIMFISL